MAKFILGKKLEMTQKFLADGRVIPVTVVLAGPCTVVQVKGDKDGYSAVQIGFEQKKKTNKPMAGHLKGLANFRVLREFRVPKIDDFARGKMFDVTTFQVGDLLKVTATSKGKGFQGVVKRHGFAGSLATHGHKDQLRMPGSIGATAPARVFKGTRMAGHMGVDTVTVKNLELIEIDPKNNLLFIKGAIPGGRNSLVKIITDGELAFVENVSKEEVKPVVEEKTEEALATPEVVEEKAEEVVAQEEVNTEAEVSAETK